MSLEFYEYMCVLELANQCENRMDTPLRILYFPTGDHMIRQKHFLYLDASVDTYGILGKFISVEYIKNSDIYNAKFEGGTISIALSQIYAQDFLYEKHT